jgi:transposase
MSANRIGIDFSQDFFDVFLAGPDGQPLAATRRFAHDRLGSQAARAWIVALGQEHPADQTWIGGEATGLLWWHLYQQWALDPDLARLHPRFFLLNPAPLKAFRRTAAQKDKTDPRDARLIARYLGVPDPELHAWMPDLTHWGLRFLTRTRCRLAHQVSATKLQALNLIYLLASAYRQVAPFGDVFGKTSRSLLRQSPSLDRLVQWPLDELAQQLQILGRGNFPDPNANARKLVEVVQRSYPLDPAVASSVHFLLDQLLELIDCLEKRLQAIDGQIAQQVAGDVDVAHLDAIGGIGPVYAAGLVAELRPTERFFQGEKYDRHTGQLRPLRLADAQAAVGKLAGLWWPRQDSGNFQAQDRHMPRACNPYLRYYLIEAANHVRRCVAEYGRFYTQKYAEVRKHPHRRALVLTARKLARLVFVLLHTHQAYQPRRAPQS